MQIVKFYKYYLSIFGVNSWHNSFLFSNLYPFSPNSNNIARCSYFFFFFFSKWRAGIIMGRLRDFGVDRSAVKNNGLHIHKE